MRWVDCIVVYIDLPGLKERAANADTSGSARMRELHVLVDNALAPGLLPSLTHAYTWNDSVLLLAHPDGAQAETACLRDADRLKRNIDAWMRQWSTTRSYAIAVKGQAFPESSSRLSSSRVTVLRTSSYAMGNCFEIEKEAKKRKLRKSWYLDGRLAKHVPKSRSHPVLSVTLFRRKRPSSVYLFERGLWDGA